MELKDIRHSVNEYDNEGDLMDAGIFIHFGEVRVKVAETPDEFIRVAERILGMSGEIRSTWIRRGAS